MPIYEYRCKACGHETEALQKMSDKPLRKCSECGRMQLQKLISAPSFRLKGEGWYETDFKSDKEQKRNIAGDTGQKSASEGSDAGKSDANKSDANKSDAGKSGDGESAGKKSEKKDSATSPGSGKSTKSGGKGSSSAVA